VEAGFRAGERGVRAMRYVAMVAGVIIDVASARTRGSSLPASEDRMFLHGVSWTSSGISHQMPDYLGFFAHRTFPPGVVSNRRCGVELPTKSSNVASQLWEKSRESCIGEDAMPALKVRRRLSPR
jgi:hypothetical protein